MRFTPTPSRFAPPALASTASDVSHRPAEQASSGQARETDRAGMPPARATPSIQGAGPRAVIPMPLNIEGTTLSNAPALRRAAAGAIATVDLGAVRQNFRTGLAKLGDGVTPAAVIKANGYGLGATKLAKVLIEEGCKDFFVARISEGTDLRQALRAEGHPMADKVAIHVLDGNLAGSDPQFLIQNRITPVLNSLEQVQAWNKAGRELLTTLPAILQVDTGMNRAGMHADDLRALLNDRDGNLGNIKLQYIMTHLSNAGDTVPRDSDAPESSPPAKRPRLDPQPSQQLGDNTPEAGEATKKQLANFDAICENFPGVKTSIGASTTVFLSNEYHKDMVRMGATFHGQAPFDADSNPLRQVLTLSSKIAQVRELSESDAIGYGLKFTAKQPMQVATIPIGYADGVPRIAAGNRPGEEPAKAYVLVGGQFKAPLVGATSMDMTTIDVTNIPPEFLKPGTKVTLMGDGITPDHFGNMYDTNPSETQTKLAGRIHMEHHEDPAVPRPAVNQEPSPNVWPLSVERTHAPEPSLLRQALTNTQTHRLKKDAAGAIATVDLGAVRENFRTGLAKLGDGVTPAAVIKANGYGLGATKLAKVLIEEGCKDFFVARISEGVDLRQALRAEGHPMADKIAIHVLDGNLAGSDPTFLIQNRITPVLNSLEQVQAWNKAGQDRSTTLPAILQVDSGMNRAGMHADDLRALLNDRDGNLGHIKLQYVMTHLANSGDVVPGEGATPEAGEATKKQLANFDAICENFPGVKTSIGASTTVFLSNEYHKDMVRMGATFHGQAPFDADSNPLRQVLTLSSKIAQVRELSESDAIGYGLKFTAKQPMQVATIPIGYADGVPRIAAGNRPGEEPAKAYVLVGGQFKAPLVGATSMDMTTIDVTNIPPEFLKPGTKVTLMGDGITPDHFGNMYDTNPSETQTKLAGRIHMEHHEDPAIPKPAVLNQEASPNVWPRSGVQA